MRDGERVTGGERRETRYRVEKRERYKRQEGREERKILYKRQETR